MTTNTTHTAATEPVAVVIHEPELVTISITIDQLHLLHTICDITRDDDDTTNPCIPFAETLYQEIAAEIAANAA